MAAVKNPHDQIVTPDTDPGRFTSQEAAAFRRGACAQDVGSPSGWGSQQCGEPSAPGASFGNCDQHNASMLVDYWPDGTPRQDTDPLYRKRPEYQDRLDAALAAHRRHCTDDACECRS